MLTTIDDYEFCTMSTFLGCGGLVQRVQLLA